MLLPETVVSTLFLVHVFSTLSLDPAPCIMPCVSPEKKVLEMNILQSVPLKSE